MISLVIFGSRTAFPTFEQIEKQAIALISDSPHMAHQRGEFEVISGCALGADTCAMQWARDLGFKLVMMPADWRTYGKLAGFRRNRQMAQRATHGLGFWDQESGGTANMCAQLALLGKPCRLVEVTG